MNEVLNQMLEQVSNRQFGRFNEIYSNISIDNFFQVTESTELIDFIDIIKASPENSKLYTDFGCSIKNAKVNINEISDSLLQRIVVTSDLSNFKRKPFLTKSFLHIIKMR